MSPKLYAYLARIDPKKQEYKITPLSLLRTSLALGISAGSNIYVEDAAAELVQDVLGIESPIVTDMATYISIVGQTIVNTIILDGVMRSVDKMFHVYLPYITDRFNAIRNSRAYQDIATQRSPFSTGKIINDTAKVTSSLSVATVFVLVAYYELKYGNYENASEAVLLALSLPVFFTEGSEAYQGYEE